MPGLDFDPARLRWVCTRYGVVQLEVFGSVGRGEVHPGSDIDLLHELGPGARLGWHIENLGDELSEVLGRPVDLVSRHALHERLRDEVLSEARVLYSA